MVALLIYAGLRRVSIGASKPATDGRVKTSHREPAESSSRGNPKEVKETACIA
jgi:hypothetical protein